MKYPNAANTQFHFAEFEAKLFIEGVEVSFDTYSVRYTENEPSILNATLNLSKDMANFISNVLRNRPNVVLAIKATGEHHNEDWHVIFVGYIVSYSFSVGPTSSSLNITAYDYLNLFNETTMYNINPAIRWLDVPSLYTEGVTIWSGDWFKKIMGNIITENFYSGIDELFNYVALSTNKAAVEYVKQSNKFSAPIGRVDDSYNIYRGEGDSVEKWTVCSAISRTRASNQYITPEIWEYETEGDALKPKGNTLMTRHPAPENNISAQEWFSIGSCSAKWNSSLVNNLFVDKRARMNFMTLSVYLTRMIWMVDEFLKWATDIRDDDSEPIKRSKEEFRKMLKIYDGEEFGVALINVSSAWRTPNCGLKGGAKNSMHKCCAAADFGFSLKKKSGSKYTNIGGLHLYILTLLADIVFRKGCVSIYSDHNTTIHCDIGPYARLGDYHSIHYDRVLRIYETKFLDSYTYEQYIAFKALIAKFVTSGLYQQVEGMADAYFHNKKEPTKLENPETDNETDEESFFGDLLKRIRKDYTEKANEWGQDVKLETNEIDTTYGLAMVRARKECDSKIHLDGEGTEEKPIKVLTQLTYENYDHDVWEPIPCLGEYRQFLLGNIICPQSSGRWSITYEIMKELYGGQAGDLSKAQFKLKEEIDSIMNTTMYEIVPIVAGARIKTEDGYSTAFWQIIPRLSTVDTKGECVPIPEVNVFYMSSAWSSIPYNVSIMRRPTAITGIVKVGDGSAPGSSDKFSEVASLYPIDLAVKVDQADFGRDVKFRQTYSTEEMWRGPVRVMKDYDGYRLGLLSAEMVKAAANQGMIGMDQIDQQQEEQLVYLLHDLTLRDYYESVLGANSVSISVGYWPYVMIGFPAEIKAEQFSIYGIVKTVVIDGGERSINTTIELRNAFNTLDDPERILKSNFSGISIYDPWLLDDDLNNIKKAIYTIGAADIKSEELVFKRSRPLFHISYLDKESPLPLRKQMRDITASFAKWQEGIGMSEVWELLSSDSKNIYETKPTWITWSEKDEKEVP